MAQTHTFTVTGMHCTSCSILITEELSELPGVRSVSVDEALQKAVVKADRDENAPQLAELFTKQLSQHGYAFRAE